MGSRAEHDEEATMQMRELLCLAATVITVACQEPTQPSRTAETLAAERVPIRISVTDLGTLGGFSIGGFAINAEGEVAGSADLPGGFPTAFLWTARQGFTEVGTLPGFDATEGFGLNNRGQVVGDYFREGEQHAFVWEERTGIVPLHDLGFSIARAINERGEVAGDAVVQPNRFPLHATLWLPKGKRVDLGTLASPELQSFASGINDRGQVVGASQVSSGEYHAFLWTPSRGMTDLGGLGGTFSAARAVNDRDEVVGVADVASGESHAFLWEARTGIHDLGTLGGTFSEARAIDPQGRIVGNSVLAGGVGRAFVWTAESGMLELPPLPGDVSSFAAGINAGGEIAGASTNPVFGPGQVHLARWQIR